ncbi:efflux transporter [Athelia psychrophila]|uniref:Efflux transporter n=1 Tax=Athelia psychrophila TaxID=1759441 RepID=A0A166DTS2_9AGAM|nr:efflux transporter [Fibularhizoctonia sp. CBS 109695]
MSESHKDESHDDARDAKTGTKVVDAPPVSLLRAIVLIITCTMAMVVNISNSTMVSIALPVIGRDLDIPEERLQWLVSAYALSSGCFLVFFGRLADLHGRKRVFIAGSAWLMAFSLGLGFVNDEITLDILRGFQGIGAAATIPSSVGILAAAFPPSRLRSFAFATFSAGAPVGAAVGMTLGGVLTQLTEQTWRSVFYLAAGLSAGVLLLGLFSIDADPPSAETDRRVDWIGAFLITAGLVLIVFVLSDGEIVGWKTPYIIALLILGALAMVLFVLWERHLEAAHTANPAAALASRWTPPPLMKMSIWGRARGRFAVTMLIAFFNWSAFLSWAFWVQLYYQDYLALTPILTMVRLLPMFVTGVLCNFAVALFIGKLGLVWIVAFGTLLTGTASLLFAVITPSAPYWAFGFPAAVVSVFGADFVFASGLIFVAKVSDDGEQSLAGGLFNVMTQIGTSFGLTISTIVFDRVNANHAGPGASAEDLRAATLAGYKAAQWTAFGFAMLSAGLAAVFLRGVGIVGHSAQSVAQDEKRALKKELKREQAQAAEGDEGEKTDKTETASIPTIVG